MNVMSLCFEEVPLSNTFFLQTTLPIVYFGERRGVTGHQQATCGLRAPLLCRASKTGFQQKHHILNKYCTVGYTRTVYD